MNYCSLDGHCRMAGAVAKLQDVGLVLLVLRVHPADDGKKSPGGLIVLPAAAATLEDGSHSIASLEVVPSGPGSTTSRNVNERKLQRQVSSVAKGASLLQPSSMLHTTCSRSSIKLLAHHEDSFLWNSQIGASQW